MYLLNFFRAESKPKSIFFKNHTPYLSQILNKKGIQDFILQYHDGITYIEASIDGDLEVIHLNQRKQTDEELGVLLPVDFDHDGDLDFFSGYSGINLFRNNGQGMFVNVSDQSFVLADGNTESQSLQTPTDALAADFDDDGDIDIFVIHSDTGCTTI